MFKFTDDTWEVAQDHIYSVNKCLTEATSKNIPQPLGMIENFYYNLLGIQGKWEEEPIESFWHLPIAQTFTDHSTWRELTSELKGDKVNCAIAAINLVGLLIQSYPFNSQFNSYQLYDFQEAQKSLEYAQQEGWDTSDILDEIQDARDKANKLKASYNPNLSATNILQTVLSKAKNELIPSDGRSYLPCFDSNDLASQVNAAQAVNGARLKQILKALGWLKLGMGKKRKSVKVQTSGMTFGNDLSSVLPSEFLKHQYLFGADFSEEKLWQTKHGKQKANCGDFFLLFDWSGSMWCNLKGNNESTIDYYEGRGIEVDPILRLDWGKAIFLKVLEMCRSSKRNTWVVPFHGRVITRKCKQFNHLTPGEEVVKFLSDTKDSGGATAWEPPLDYAIGRIKDSGKRTVNGRWKHSDVLYITDADGYEVDYQFIQKVAKFKKDYNISVHVILISKREDVEQKLLDTIADKVINIGRLSIEQVALQTGELLLSYE